MFGGGGGSVGVGGASTIGTNGSSCHEYKDKIRHLPNVQAGTLQCEHLVREGTYGRIYGGKLTENCDVLIKTVVDGASLTQVACLLQDAGMLIGVTHLNVLAPMLANTELPGPPEIAYPYPSKGNLKMYEHRITFPLLLFLHPSFEVHEFYILLSLSVVVVVSLIIDFYKNPAK